MLYWYDTSIARTTGFIWPHDTYILYMRKSKADAAEFKESMCVYLKTCSICIRFFVINSSFCILLLSSCLPSGLLVAPLCWSISWTFHTRPIVPANSNLVLGTPPGPREHIRFVFFSFIFPFLLSFLSVFFFLFLLLFFECTYITMDMFLVLFSCKWYGMVYHSSLVPFPLRSGTVLPCALFVLVCFLPSRCIFATLYSLLLWPTGRITGNWADVRTSSLQLIQVTTYR